MLAETQLLSVGPNQHSCQPFHPDHNDEVDDEDGDDDAVLVELLFPAGSSRHLSAALSRWADNQEERFQPFRENQDVRRCSTEMFPFGGKGGGTGKTLSTLWGMRMLHLFLLSHPTTFVG